jgi:sugar phosphate isomerase/epimerase
MQALGFSSVELEGIRKEHLLQMYALRFETARKIADLSLNVPYFCVVLAALSSIKESERAEALGLFEKGCEVAKVLNARGVLDNGPLPPYIFPEEVPIVRHFDVDVLQSASLPADLNWGEYWQALVSTYREACDIAAVKGLTYHLHPCQGALTANTDAFLYFHAAVDRENLKFNFDTANQFFARENLVLSLCKAAEHIDYIHISDNCGDRVEHIEPEKGIIEWQGIFEILDTIGFDGHIGIDIGGEESGVTDLDGAYVRAAQWLEKIWT